MANYSTLKAAINAVIKTNGQKEITGEVLNQVLNAMVTSLGTNYQFAGVATPSTNPGTPDQNVFYMATQAGTYTNFNATVLPAGISILLWNGSWSSETFFTVESTPTSGSTNLVTSGGVFEKMKLDGGAYDVSAHNGGTTFASLEALLSDANLNTLIPVAVRIGGMSIRFVQTSDNKYVQFRLMSDTFNTTPANWQGVDAVPTYDSKNLCESGGIQTELKNIGFLNISAEFPTGGVDSEGQSGGNRYTFYTAKNKLVNRFSIGMTMTFLNTNGIEETWKHIAGTTDYNSPSNWMIINKVPVGYCNFFEIDNATTKVYSEGLAAIYVDGFLIPDYSVISAHCYAGNFVYYIASNTPTRIAFSSIENNQQVELKASINSVETVVGFVVFKDKSKWVDNSVGNALMFDKNKVCNPQYIVNGSIITEKIADGAVTKEKVADNAVETAKIKDENVTFNKLEGNVFKEFIYDVSLLHPTRGVDGGDTYAGVNTAATVIPQNKRSAGMTIKFKSSVTGVYEVWQRNGLSFPTQFHYQYHWTLINTEEFNFNYYILENNITRAYTDGLKYIYIDPVYISSSDRISLKCYSGKLYLSINGVNLINGVEFSTIENGDIIPIQKEIDNVLTTIGSLCFRDKSKFTSNPGSDSFLKHSIITDISRVPQETPTVENAVEYVPQSLTDAQKQQARTNIGAAKDVTPLVITIPNKVYAVVGTEMNIWNDNVSLPIDRGLASPLNYRIQWICGKGIQTERGFRYTPVAGDVGASIYCVCKLYNMNDEKVAEKTFQIVVLAQNALNTPKNIVYFGASLGASTCRLTYGDFTNSNKFTGTAPNMLGTRGTGDYHYEAVGGYMWSDYATAGRHAYRVYVNNIGALGLGAVYSITINGTTKNLTVREVNADNILLEASYGAAVADFPTSGTLTWVSGTGDPTISFDNTGHTDGGETPNNPLWNENTNQLDIALYKQRLGLQPTDKLDAVSFDFGGNDHNLADDLTTLMGYIDDLYSAFIGDNPNCKFIIGMTTKGGNTVDGAGISYGATYNVEDIQNDIYRIVQFYLSLQGSTQYPNIRICPHGLEIDRYYGYDFENRAISQRYPTTEKVHNNYRHPGESGYGQLADAFFATYIGVLTE